MYLGLIDRITYYDVVVLIGFAYREIEVNFLMNHIKGYENEYDLNKLVNLCLQTDVGRKYVRIGGISKEEGNDVIRTKQSNRLDVLVDIITKEPISCVETSNDKIHYLPIKENELKLWLIQNKIHGMNYITYEEKEVYVRRELEELVLRTFLLFQTRIKGKYNLQENEYYILKGKTVSEIDICRYRCGYFYKVNCRSNVALVKAISKGTRNFKENGEKIDANGREIYHID